MTNVDLLPPPRCYIEFYRLCINCTTRKLGNLHLLLKQQIHFWKYLNRKYGENSSLPHFTKTQNGQTTKFKRILF